MPAVEKGLRWRIVSLSIDAGWSYKEIADHFGLAKSTIQDQIKRWRERDSIEDRLRSGRPASLHQGTLVMLQQNIQANPFKTIKELQQDLRNRHHTIVSPMTISRALQRMGLKSYRPLKFPRLRDNHKMTRLRFARHHRHWSAQQEWRQVIFTDESRFGVRWTDGRLRVRRLRGHRNSNEAAVQWTDGQNTGGSVMVWAGISWHHKSELVLFDGSMTGDRYLHEIVERVAVPFGLASIGPGFIYQDDNAPAHRAGVVLDYHEENVNYFHLNWPSKSPDLNPIEHAWDILGKRLREREPRRREDIYPILAEEWHAIPQAKIQRLIRSMRSRMEAVIENQGSFTRY